MKKKKKSKIIKVLEIICLLLAITTIIVVCIFKPKTKTVSNDSSIIGIWTTDNVTIYEFEKNNTGVLKVPLSEYKFTYKIEKDKLYIDFENEKSEDSEYTYTLKDKKLILKGKKGTFTFKRIKNID